MSDGGSSGLVAESVSVRYGGVAAVDAVSVQVRPGEVVGLIGPNGAGKTSFVDAISGFAPCEGTIVLDGKPIHSLKPHERRAAGLSRTWQAGELFGTLTVAQNILVASGPPTLTTAWKDIFGRRENRASVVSENLELVGLPGAAETKAAELTLGQQKLVGVARALAGGCSTLLLDEPAAGLDSTESASFADRLRIIVETGLGALLIDHDVDLMVKACDKVYVLEFGKLIFEGSASDMRTDPGVVAAYLGSPVEG